jgi:hypothetical protein
MDESKQPHGFLPRPSYWPIVMAFGFFLLAIGIIYSLLISAAGILIVLVAMIAWVIENRKQYIHEEEQ